MALKGNDMNIDLAGTEISVTKHMLADPRRIGQIDVALNFPLALQLNEKDKTILQRIGDTCPVAKSLHPDLKVHVVYNW
jgi:uncharacterized OsmC-like protein